MVSNIFAIYLNALIFLCIRYFNCFGCSQLLLSNKKAINTVLDITQNSFVISLIKNFVGHLWLWPLETSYQVTNKTWIRMKSTWTTRTNGGIRLDSRRLNEERKRLRSRTRVEARPQSETNRREGGQAR